MSGSASIVWAVPLTLRLMRAMGAYLPDGLIGNGEGLRSGRRGHGWDREVRIVSSLKGNRSRWTLKHPLGRENSAQRSQIPGSIQPRARAGVASGRDVVSAAISLIQSRTVVPIASGWSS